MLAHAKRAAPWAFNPDDNRGGPALGPVAALDRLGGGSGRRSGDGPRKKHRRQLSEASDLSDDEEITDPAGRRRQRSAQHEAGSSFALMSQLGLTHKTKLSGAEAISVVIEA